MRSPRPSRRSSPRSPERQTNHPAEKVRVTDRIPPPVKVLALDYGAARTGLAVSDPTGTIARPLGIVERASGEAGLAEIVRIAEREGVEQIVVGLPLTLRGEHGGQATETERFVDTLRAATDLPVDTFDERFTTRLAQANGGGAPEDAAAAAHLLTSYLTWLSALEI
jgi:putative holliday junction resolvase